MVGKITILEQYVASVIGAVVIALTLNLISSVNEVKENDVKSSNELKHINSSLLDLKTTMKSHERKLVSLELVVERHRAESKYIKK